MSLSVLRGPARKDFSQMPRYSKIKSRMSTHILDASATPLLALNLRFCTIRASIFVVQAGQQPCCQCCLDSNIKFYSYSDLFSMFLIKNNLKS